MKAFRSDLSSQQFKKCYTWNFNGIATSTSWQFGSILQTFKVAEFFEEEELNLSIASV